MNNRKAFFLRLAIGSVLLVPGQKLALAAPDVVGTHIQTIYTRFGDPAIDPASNSFWSVPDRNPPLSPPSPDPSGLTYLPSSGHLLICDGEVDEMPIYAGATLFEIDLFGNLLSTYTTATTSAYSNLNAFSNEPVGMAFNPLNGHLFISDDDQHRVYEIALGANGVFDATDTRTWFSTSAFGSNDPEGLAFDPTEGVLYIADGLNSEIYKVMPNSNGFDGVWPVGDDGVTHFDTLGIGVEDPEGIEFEPPDRLYVAGEPTTRIAHIYTEGPLIRMVDIPGGDTRKTAGLAIGPSSDPISYPASSVYIAARGVDNDSDPNENDGTIFEFSVPPLPAGNLAPGVAAGPEQTISLPASADLDGTLVDDGLPIPPEQITTTWSKLSGPGTVTFGNANELDTTASFSTDGEYVLRLTANDTDLQSIHDVMIHVRPPFSAGFKTVYISSTGGGTAGGISFKDEDIIACTYSGSACTWSMYFDGSDVGLGASGVDIDAFTLMTDDSILLSFASPTTITIDGSATPVDDSDIVRFVPTHLGSNTTGSFEWYLDGSDVGLDTDGENIDAIAFTTDGKLAISTTGDFTVRGVSGSVSGKDEDLIAFTASDLGEESNGTWAMHFDGSDVELSQNSNEDVNGAWIDSNNGANSDIYLTTKSAFAVTGVSGGGDDIFKCVPAAIGKTTACSYAFTWDGLESGLPAGTVLDGIELVR